MNTKLTLTIEEEIIKKAKEYAKKNKRSLSDIIESYLKIITREKKANKSEKLNPVVRSLRGSFKIPKNMDYKKELEKRVEEKYL